MGEDGKVRVPRKKSATSPPKRAVEDFSIDRKMLELLVCPLTKHSLTYDAKKQELKSKSARLAYPVRGGIPIMLPSEARALEDNEL